MNFQKVNVSYWNIKNIALNNYVKDEIKRAKSECIYEYSLSAFIGHPIDQVRRTP